MPGIIRKIARSIFKRGAHGKRRAALAVVIALLGASTAAQAQHQRGPPAPAPTPPAAEPMSDAVHEAMTLNMAEGAHIRLSPARAGTMADSARALAIADTLRAAIARYQDTALALHDGYRMFAPNVKGQLVLHYSRWTSALQEAFRFDPSQPTSLLYVREPAGRLKLIGAMYTAPKSAREGELDRRVPLSIGRWHRHVNLCLPRRGQESRLTERRNGVLQFGPAGAIDTSGECDAAGGRFFASLFGWMIHANVYAGTDIASIWGGEHHEH